MNKHSVDLFSRCRSRESARPLPASAFCLFMPPAIPLPCPRLLSTCRSLICRSLVGGDRSGATLTRDQLVWLSLDIKDTECVLMDGCQVGDVGWPSRDLCSQFCCLKWSFFYFMTSDNFHKNDRPCSTSVSQFFLSIF